MRIPRIFLNVVVLVVFAAALAFAQDSAATTKPAPPKTEKKMKESKEIVVMETNMGAIELAMYGAEAPKTVENFVKLAQKGYYNGITFHRVIDNFMIQGGDPTGTGAGGESIYGAKFEDEINPKLKFDHAGILAMANAGPNTNGSQFFITVAPTPWLDMHHSVFGEVTEGYEVVRKISEVARGAQDRPLKEVRVNSVKIER